MDMTKTVLIVDDEPDIRELLEITLGRMGLNTYSVGDLTQAKNIIEEKAFNLCLTDMRLPDGNGIDFVKYISKHHPDIPVAVFTAHGNMDTAVIAMKAGAFDFITKPVDIDHLRALVTSALNVEKAPATQNIEERHQLIGKSAPIEKLRKKIFKLSRSQAPVFISGESGSGKELVARSIHYSGPRAEGPFVPVNCGAIPKELMESEFFGHIKGSFTGAQQDKIGLFQAADNGTLFLDEVADLPLDMQVKLLRALQEKAIRPIGGNHEININIRILSATHKNLQHEVETGRFRSDLFYRLNVIDMTVPPLRVRHDDTILLANHFLSQLSQEFGMAAPKLSVDAQHALLSYDFPGNVRELHNILERAFTLCEDDEIGASDLALSATPLEPGTAVKPEPVLSGQPKPSQTFALNGESLDNYLEGIERSIITQALEKVRWNKTAAAKRLGITFRSLRYRLKKLGLDDDTEE